MPMMVSTQDAALPQLPLLDKGTDLDAWTSVLIQTLRFHGLADYILKAPTEIVKTARNNAFVMVLITTSASPVMGVLTAAGWNVHKVDHDPKHLYDLILRVMPPEADRLRQSPIIEELNRPKASDFLTLSDFLAEVRRLKQQLGTEYRDNETWGVPVVVSAVRQGRELWHQSLMVDMVAGRLTWSKLMDRIAHQAAHESSLGREERDDTYDDEDLDTYYSGDEDAYVSAKDDTETRSDHSLTDTDKNTHVFWKPPPGSWEELIAELNTFVDNGSVTTMVELTWKNGNKTHHEIDVIYQRCPRKMLQFYEREGITGRASGNSGMHAPGNSRGIPRDATPSVAHSRGAAPHDLHGDGWGGGSPCSTYMKNGNTSSHGWRRLSVSQSPAEKNRRHSGSWPRGSQFGPGSETDVGGGNNWAVRSPCAVKPKNNIDDGGSDGSPIPGSRPKSKSKAKRTEGSGDDWW